MISEALKFLADLGAQAAGAEAQAKIMQDPVEPKIRWLVHDGDCTPLATPIPDRKHALQSIAEFPALIEHAKKSYAPREKELTPTVWIGGEFESRQGTHPGGQVIAILDDSWESSREDRAICRLVLTSEFLLLRMLARGEGIEQKAFRRLLRVDLAQCSVPQALIEWVSAVNWSLEKQSRGNLGRGRESLGADVEASAISDAGEMPEGVMLQVRVFTDTALCAREEIPCLFGADPKSETFTLQPLGGALQAAFEGALNAARENLIGCLPTDVPCFLGAPH